MEWIAADWQPSLSAKGLHGFNDIWDLELDWFEEPNKRRGGWSGVVRMQLDRGEVFIKRQENHRRRTLRHPLKGIDSYQVEFENIQQYRLLNIPTLVPVYFSNRVVTGHSRAILITEALNDYTPLDELVSVSNRSLSQTQRRKIINVVSSLLRQIHDAGYMQNNFYPKHVFMKQEGETWHARVIDIETARRSLIRGRARFRDLDSFNRKAYGWSRTERLRFLLSYMNKQRLDTKTKQLWRRLHRRYTSKVNRK